MEAPPQVTAPPYIYRPPFSGLVKAVTHEKDFVVPLGIDEQCYAFQPTDFVLVFKQKAEPDRLAEALEQALVAFPQIAGRFIVQDVVSPQPRVPLLIGATLSKPRLCILCNNAGAGWSALEYTQSAPSCLGPMSNSLVEFVEKIEPQAGGKIGGPLFTARLSSYIDGQTLGISFAQGLSDCKGIGLFLHYWSCLFRGEDPGPPPKTDRLDLDEAFRRLEPPRIQSYFALQNKSCTPTPRLVPEKNVVSFSWSADEVQDAVAAIQNERKSRHLTLDRAGKNLEALDVGCGAVLRGFETTVPVQMWVDYRAELYAPMHFGNARGQIAFDTPPKYEDACEMIRRRVFGARSVDFWNWQRLQATKVDHTGVTIFPLVDDLALADICFHAGDVPCVGLPLCLWEEQMKSPGYIAVLPEPSGGCHVEALVPKTAAVLVSKKIGCKMLAIR